MSDPSTPPAPDSPEAGDVDTSSLYGGGPDDRDTADADADLMSADSDPLPDEQVTDPSTPQGPSALGAGG